MKIYLIMLVLFLMSGCASLKCKNKGHLSQCQMSPYGDLETTASAND